MHVTRKSLRESILLMALVTISGVAATAKDSRQVTLPHDAVLNGTALPAGQYSVSWEAHGTEAKVEFARGHKVLLSTEGTLEDRGQRYRTNTVIYATAPDGTLTLSEIRFAGSNQAVVLKQ